MCCCCCWKGCCMAYAEWVERKTAHPKDTPPERAAKVVCVSTQLVGFAFLSMALLNLTGSFLQGEAVLVNLISYLFIYLVWILGCTFGFPLLFGKEKDPTVLRTTTIVTSCISVFSYPLIHQCRPYEKDSGAFFTVVPGIMLLGMLGGWKRSFVLALGLSSMATIIVSGGAESLGAECTFGLPQSPRSQVPGVVMVVLMGSVFTLWLLDLWYRKMERDRQALGETLVTLVEIVDSLRTLDLDSARAAIDRYPERDPRRHQGGAVQKSLHGLLSVLASYRPFIPPAVLASLAEEEVGAVAVASNSMDAQSTTDQKADGGGGGGGQTDGGPLPGSAPVSPSSSRLLVGEPSSSKGSLSPLEPMPQRKTSQYQPGSDGGSSGRGTTNRSGISPSESFRSNRSSLEGSVKGGRGKAGSVRSSVVREAREAARSRAVLTMGLRRTKSALVCVQMPNSKEWVGATKEEYLDASARFGAKLFEAATAQKGVVLRFTGSNAIVGFNMLQQQGSPGELACKFAHRLLHLTPSPPTPSSPPVPSTPGEGSVSVNLPIAKGSESSIPGEPQPRALPRLVVAIVNRTILCGNIGTSEHRTLHTDSAATGLVEQLASFAAASFDSSREDANDTTTITTPIKSNTAMAPEQPRGADPRDPPSLVVVDKAIHDAVVPRCFTSRPFDKLQVDLRPCSTLVGALPQEGMGSEAFTLHELLNPTTLVETEWMYQLQTVANRGDHSSQAEIFEEGWQCLLSGRYKMAHQRFAHVQAAANASAAAGVVASEANGAHHRKMAAAAGRLAYIAACQRGRANEVVSAISGPLVFPDTKSTEGMIKAESFIKQKGDRGRFAPAAGEGTYHRRFGRHWQEFRLEEGSLLDSNPASMGDITQVWGEERAEWATPTSNSGRLISHRHMSMNSNEQQLISLLHSKR